MLISYIYYKYVAYIIMYNKYTHIYTYIWREREGDRQTERKTDIEKFGLQSRGWLTKLSKLPVSIYGITPQKIKGIHSSLLAIEEWVDSLSGSLMNLIKNTAS